MSASIKAQKAARVRKWRKDNPEKARAIKRRWQNANPEKRREMARRYYAKHADKIKAAAKQRAIRKREADPEKAKERAREKHLKSAYGMTPSAFAAMLTGQGCRCAICGKENGYWVVDHNHENGNIRGVLCRECNTGLGCFKDSTDTMLSAVKYLMVN